MVIKAVEIMKKENICIRLKKIIKNASPTKFD